MIQLKMCIIDKAIGLPYQTVPKQRK